MAQSFVRAVVYRGSAFTPLAFGGCPALTLISAGQFTVNHRAFTQIGPNPGRRLEVFSWPLHGITKLFQTLPLFKG
jgi:hypothetical protein